MRPEKDLRELVNIGEDDENTVHASERHAKYKNSQQLPLHMIPNLLKIPALSLR